MPNVHHNRTAVGVSRRTNLHRARLFGALSRATTRPLTIVQAGGGWGKTTLLADWAASQVARDAPVIWLSASEAAPGPDSLWEWIVEGLVKTGLIEKHSGDDVDRRPETDAELRTGILTLFRALPSAVTLVIDDVDFSDDRRTFDALLWLLERVDHVHLVISTRLAYSVVSALAAARLQPTVVTASELAYTTAELQAVAGHKGVRLDDDAGAEITRQVAGWPLGARLVIRELARGPQVKVDSQRVASAIQTVKQFFMSHLMGKPTGASRLEYLLHCSVAEELPRDLALSLSRGSDYEQHLNWAQSEGIALGTVCATVRLVPLIRSALEAELELRGRDTAIAQRRILALWASDAGEALIALRSSAQISDWELLATVVKRHVTKALHSHRNALWRALRAVPMQVLRDQPVLLAVYTMTLTLEDLHDLEYVRSLLKPSSTVEETTPLVRSGEHSFWTVICRMAIARLTGNYQDAGEQADKLAEMIPTVARENPDWAETLSTIRVQQGITYLFCERFADAVHIFVGESNSEDPNQRSRAVSLLAVSHALHGNMRECDRLLALQRDESLSLRWRSSYDAVAYHLAAALSRIEVFDSDGAAQHLADLPRNAIEFRPIVLRIEMVIALVRNESLEYLDRVSSMPCPPRTTKAPGPLAPLLAVGRADLLLAAGYPERALGALDSSGLSPLQLALGRARVALARHRPADANAAVAPLTSADSTLPRNRAEALLTRAVAMKKARRITDALIFLKRALVILEENQLRRPLMMLPRPELTSLMHLLESREGAPAVKLLDGVPDVFTVSETTTPLSPRELVVLDVSNRMATTEEVAERLFVSTNTVKTQLSSIYRKLGVSTREEALVIARERGLLTPRSKPLARG